MKGAAGDEEEQVGLDPVIRMAENETLRKL